MKIDLKELAVSALLALGIILLCGVSEAIIR
jgi:hypothetical protein